MKRLLIILLAVLLMGTSLCGCQSKTYTARVHQEFENVVKIELLDTSDQLDVCLQSGIKVLYTLDETELQPFWNDLHEVDFRRYFNDPPTIHGPLSIRIYYKDGYIDYIGCGMNTYFSPNGKNIARDGWYYAEDIKDFDALFAKYIKESTPESVG